MINFIRKFVRKFLLIFNMRLIKISLAEKILWQFSLKNKKVKFLQIGANDGVSFDCLYEYATAQEWTGVVVEPLTDFYNKLCYNYEYYKKIQPVNLGIHPYLKKFDLYRVDSKYHNEYPDWVRGTASFKIENLLNQGIHLEKIILNSVPSLTLMELINIHDLIDIDYLQIDVEGMDGEIIKMIDFNKIKPKLIRFEWKHIESIEMDEIKEMLKKENYNFIWDKDDFFCFLTDVI